MTSTPEARIKIVLNEDLLREFFPIFQAGVGMSARVGCSLANFLNDQLNLDSEYIAGRITTIFLDCKPVDNVKTAIIRNGSTIALSGAMPGLVGATMRRGGFYAAMRSSISHENDAADSINKIGTVRVKLFNLLMGELGPALLRRGVIVSASSLFSFFNDRPESFWRGCFETVYNGTPVEPSALSSPPSFGETGTIRLYAEFK